MSHKLLIVVASALLGCASLHAADRILVASTRSNSLEEFTPAGTWVRTFATTGPYAPYAIAQSPVTGEIFVTTAYASGVYAGQFTNRILRYQPDRRFDTNWDTFTVTCPVAFVCPTTQTNSLLFDSSGNLWVATSYGLDDGGPIYIFEYLAANLTLPDPPAEPAMIVANMYRGDQMAFNTSGDLCIAGFIDEDVKCFNPATGALTQDYYAEIHSSSVYGIEPAGLAFDADNRMYLSSVFTGQVVKELKPGGPIVLLATLVSSPNLLNANLALRDGHLYVPTYFNPAPTYSTPDAVYKVSAATGAVTNLIVGSAAPALGDDHIWGANGLAFVSTPH